MTEPVFIVATLLVALLGLWGMRQLPLRWWLIFGVGFIAMVAAVDQFSPISEGYRAFLDARAALRNLHKFDPLVRLPLVAGVAVALGRVEWPGLNRARWRQWQHPKRTSPCPAPLPWACCWQSSRPQVGPAASLPPMLTAVCLRRHPVAQRPRQRHG